MEFVYVIKNEELPSYSDLVGTLPNYCPNKPNKDDALFGGGFFIERSYAERDPNFKQLIPYGIIRKEDKIFFMRRKAVSETRLTGKGSIGVGGHINPIDNGSNIFSAALEREIQEEIIINSYDYNFIGLLYDNSNEVGSVHLGLIYEINTPDNVLVRETNNLEGKFMTIDEIKKEVNLESWSSILLDKYF